jgi:hypothetical protein
MCAVDLAYDTQVHFANMTYAPRYVPHYTVADHATWEGEW